jgi:hypothetical protein
MLLRRNRRERVAASLAPRWTPSSPCTATPIFSAGSPGPPPPDPAARENHATAAEHHIDDSQVDLQPPHETATPSRARRGDRAAGKTVEGSRPAAWRCWGCRRLAAWRCGDSAHLQNLSQKKQQNQYQPPNRALLPCISVHAKNIYTAKNPNELKIQRWCI